MKALFALLFLVAAAVADNQCPSDWTKEELLRHENCNKFYKCTYGVPVEQQCFGDLYFNLETWQCDWQHNVDCSGRIDPAAEKSAEVPVESEEDQAPETETVPEESNELTESKEATQESEETQETEEASKESEQSEEESEQAPEESAQTSEESEESEQAPEESEQAPEESEQAPEESEQAPEESEQAPEESEQAPEETGEPCEEDSSEQQPELEFQENGCPVNPHVHWLLPHEEDCNQFYYCVWGQKQLRNCPAALHFNRNLQVCDWPADAGCAVSAKSANKHYGFRAAAVFNNH